MIVLKIIGIVLGAILLLILLLLLWILFSPIRYRGRFIYDGKPDLNVKISYLLWIVRGFYIIDSSGSRYDVKVLWKSLLDSKESKSKKSKKIKKKVKTPTTKETKPAIIKKEPDDFLDEHEKIKITPKETKKPEQKALPDKKDKKKEKKSIFKKLKELYNKITGVIKNLIDKKNKVMEEINDERNRDAVKFALKLLGKLLKHLLPRKHKISVEFGTGDPATTGELLGVLYALAAMFSLNLSVTPDFEEKIFKCDVPFKGRVSVFLLLVWLIQAYRHENLRRLIDKIRK